MKTNILLDDDLILQAMKYSTARTKREVVREALIAYVAVKSAEQRSKSYKDRLAGIRLKLLSMPARPSSQELVRADRDRQHPRRRG